MPSFDFITHGGFRRALESDYAEMEKCFESCSWKSVQVLAGSIVEALLIDYLVATQANRTGKNPLRMDLSEAVTVCKDEHVITERTADLSSVIRSYRNLIHPGRAVRLDEPYPSHASAQIAISLVALILEEVAAMRRNAFGLTAEQIASKVERDTHSISILPHLLSDANEQQLERLLRDIIPHRYFELETEIFDDDFLDIINVQERLEHTFRSALQKATPELRTRIAAEFVRTLREEDGGRVVAYGEAFFRATDLRDLSENHRDMVLEHLISRMSPTLDHGVLKMLTDIEQYLTPSHVQRWLDPILKAITAKRSHPVNKDKARDYLIHVTTLTSLDIDAAIQQRLNEWETHYEAQGSEESAARIRQLKAELFLWDELPF